MKNKDRDKRISQLLAETQDTNTGKVKVNFAKLRELNQLQNGHKVVKPFCSLMFDLDKKWGIPTNQLYMSESGFELWTNHKDPTKNKRPFYRLKDLPYNFKGKGGKFQHYKISEVISEPTIIKCIEKYHTLIQFKEGITYDTYQGFKMDRNITYTKPKHILFRDQKNRLYSKAIPIRQLLNCLLFDSECTKRTGEYITSCGFKWRILNKDFYHLHDWVQNKYPTMCDPNYIDIGLNGREASTSGHVKYRKNNKNGWRGVRYLK